MNILDLPLKAIWYNMIESGKKKEEYREHNSYWAKRFYACYDKNTDCKIYIPEKCKYCCKPSLKYYDAVRFRYGYTKRTMLFKKCLSEKNTIFLSLLIQAKINLH